MRNIIFILIASICFCSCMKTYDCKCTPDANVSSNKATGNETMQLNDKNKSDAKTRCKEYERKLMVNDFFYNCTLD